MAQASARVPDADADQPQRERNKAGRAPCIIAALRTLQNRIVPESEQVHAVVAAQNIPRRP
jgi:hypothetical protein